MVYVLGKIKEKNDFGKKKGKGYFGSATNVMLFFRSKGVATPLLRKNRKKKTLNLQHYRYFDTIFFKQKTFAKQTSRLLAKVLAVKS